jgi:RNA polymerase-binding transcription factor DksA
MVDPAAHHRAADPTTEPLMTTTVLHTTPTRAAHPERDAIARLRAALLAHREREAVLATDRERSADELAGQLDPDSILERELAEVSAARARRAVQAIDDALARMDDGSYGICASCGKAIPAARLEALPYARTCVACASGRTR